MGQVYYRITPEGQHLKAEDYKYGFGLDSSHYNRIHEARRKYNQNHPESPLLLRDNFKEDWDTRTGCSIENKPFHTRHHPLHDIRLKELETGKIYIIDSVHKHHYFGLYLMLLIRAEGTESHGSIIWENISCLDPDTLESIKETHKRFEVLK